MTCQICGREVHYMHHIQLDGGWLDVCHGCFMKRKEKE